MMLGTPPAPAHEGGECSERRGTAWMENIMNTRRDALAALYDAGTALRHASGGDPDAVAYAQAAATFAMASAQTHLAEQTRIQNRIALAVAVSDAEARSQQIGARPGLVGGIEGLYDHPTTESGRAPLRDDIADALGL